MKTIEKVLVEIHNREGGGLLSQEDKDMLIRLEGRRNTLLLEREETWRLKSREIWLDCGDDNTNKFHAYARGRKAANIVWSLPDEQGTNNDIFDGMVGTRVEHFKQLFKAPA